MTPAEQLAAAFAREHAGEAAHFFESAAPPELGAWLASLPAAHAAAVVGRAVPVAAAAALSHMTPEVAAAIVAELEPRAAAALLRRLPRPEAEAIVAQLAPRAAENLSLLIRYRADQAGSRLDPRAPAVSPDTTVEQALAVVRRAADGALNYVYVLAAEQRLCGVVSMRELMLADPAATVRSVMIEHPYSVAARDPLEAVISHPGWRKAHAMPVVDDAGHFLGVIRYSQFRALEVELGRTHGVAHRRDTTAALAELFWLGSASMLRLGEAAVFGRLARNPEDER
jgi:magnesium transporter